MANEKVTVVLVHENREYKYVIPDDLAISEATLNKDYVEHVAKVAWHNVLTARLSAENDRAAHRLKEARAQADEVVRNGFAAAGTKTTESMVQAKVETSPQVQKALKESSIASEQLGVAMAIKDAFYHRKDMLVSLGATMRDQHALTIKEKA